MSFNANIPTGTDPIAQSFSQLRANFRQIASSFAENHVPLSQSQNAGKHRLLTLQPVSDPGGEGDSIAVYNKIVGINPPNLFFLGATPFSSPAFQLTYDSVNTEIDQAQQYSFMAGPFIVYGGRLNGVVSGNTVVLQPNKTLIHVDITIISTTVLDPTNMIPINMVGNSFDLYGNFSGAVDIFYLAIGI